MGVNEVAGPSTLWADRVLLVLTDSPGGHFGSAEAVVEEVALRFAHKFAPTDRTYRGDVARWQQAVLDALAELGTTDLLLPDDGTGPTVSDRGRARADRVRKDVENMPAPADPPIDPAPLPGALSASGPLITPGVIATPLRSAAARQKVGFPSHEDEPGPVMAEINLRFRGGSDDAFDRLTDLWRRVTRTSPLPDRRPTALGDEYATGQLSLNEMKRLVSADTAGSTRSTRSLRRIWPDFEVREQVDASCVTVKADAAHRAFNAYGDRIVWAVIDSGIDATHPHFAAYDTLRHESVADLHRFFPLDGDPTDDPEPALVDESGHGTHVAGIIAGAAGPWLSAAPGRTIQATESRFNIEMPHDPLRMPRPVDDPSLVAGMAPKTKLVSLKVLQSGGSQQSRVARVIKALEYVRDVNGESTDSMRIHGVNLSLGYEFDPEWFACGQSPLCKEVDKLVRTGVVVVVAAGNSGYGSLAVTQDAPTRFGLGMTINDPGNAALAITVGSTHRDAPHTYGVSYFSSKGPTGDGRPKPDLVAPGERITSCAAGRNLTSVVGDTVPTDTAVYVEDSGTSMAAPHVSGAAAALLSVHREFIGRPDEVKETLMKSAITLHRNPDFQGAGLLDLMRALQSI
jgi:serine protease AprX